MKDPLLSKNTIYFALVVSLCSTIRILSCYSIWNELGKFYSTFYLIMCNEWSHPQKIRGFPFTYLTNIGLINVLKYKTITRCNWYFRRNHVLQGLKLCQYVPNILIRNVIGQWYEYVHCFTRITSVVSRNII